MAILVIVEHNNQTMHPVTRQMVTAAKEFKQPCRLLVAGFNCQTVADEAARIAGVDEVLIADNACFEHQMPENIAKLVTSISPSFDVVLASSSAYGKNLLPRIAALLEVAQVSDVTKVITPNTFEHPIYAGNAIETVQTLDEKRVLSIRATAFAAETTTQPPCAFEKIMMEIPWHKSTWISNQYSPSERPELTQAKIIVSGGRGLQSRENFVLIEQLADSLGAAIGASRAAVDAGFVPNDYQVGQTGKVVAPLLYFAIGISGAVQHLAGMKDSKVVVAINKDEDAPIMQMANYYLVGDLFALVPQLIEKLKKA